jgi:thiamine kinase
VVEDLSQPHTGELALGDALAHVPGYRAGDPTSVISQLRGGGFNRSYHLRTAAGEFVLRLSQAPDAWLAADRSAERQLHGIAAAAGIAPQVVDATDAWLITRYVSGRLWAGADFADASCLARLGETLRRLHALPVPEHCLVDLRHVLERYVGRIGTEDASLLEHLQSADAAWRVSGADKRAAAILHHDLHAQNLVDAPDGLVLIDWECAAVSDPLLDVACILSYHPSARPFAGALLQHCGLGGVTPMQLAACVWLFELHTYLWYRERRRRLRATEAELDAERDLSLRLAATVRDWRLPA